MAANTRNVDTDSRTRASALRHAHNIEEKKRLRARITDLIIEAFDLPSNLDADVARPTLPDLRLFKECLSLFQPSDLQDLVYERNVDNKCGYALCSKPNAKIHHDGQKVWNRKGGQGFKLVDKAEMERWCSKACEDRNKFVLAQLSTEPAWIRGTQTTEHIRLLDEIQQDGDLTSALQELSINPDSSNNLADKLEALSLERGASNIHNVGQSISVIEKSNEKSITSPPNPDSKELIEGYNVRKAPHEPNRG